MRIETFQKKHIPEATAIALANYQEQKQKTDVLPVINALPALNGFAENGLGVAAVEDGRLVGFLCSCDPFENAFRSTDVRGVFSPMGAHGAIAENRLAVYERMYQAAAEKWVAAGAVSHAICLYAHDAALQHLFFTYGFGLRCVDAIRPMELLACAPCPGYSFRELEQARYAEIHPLELALHRHYRQSPFFMYRTPDGAEVFLREVLEEKSRFFVAEKEGKICAYLKIHSQGETFIAAGSGYRHIHGAYCLPEHRGRGVYQNLINTAIHALHQEGYTHLGVDYESINPTAMHFWGRHFMPYTASVVRRIDERILR